MEKKDIVKERRCLQVNYVTFKTDWPVDQWKISWIALTSIFFDLRDLMPSKQA
jgi:hypothetical protein